MTNDSIRSLMEKAFDEVLPIPKTPRVYTPPPTQKAWSWVPSGSFDSDTYRERLELFANEIRAIYAQATRRMKYSSRGWCYLLEGLRKIDKEEFGKCQNAINDCRKLGYLPIDFVAEDQDITRRFSGIHEASDPSITLEKIKGEVDEMLAELPASNTDYWDGEKYYLMMCVEKGDILNLFKTICKEYHVPVVSSKGWAPILLRAHIAALAQKAEVNGLIPVLLLFYDHDPAGMKIPNTFRKNLEDVSGGTGWHPDDLLIDRFGLNADDIEKYDLMWIDNLKSSSGRESRDWRYIGKYGRRKCESNALFKTGETLDAGEQICRNAIEKYYGSDAKERFQAKEEESKKNLKEIYEDDMWDNFNEKIDEMMDSLEEETGKEDDLQPIREKEVDVFVDGRFFGYCPECNRSFDYDEDRDIGKLVRCRYCNLPIRLKRKERGAATK